MDLASAKRRLAALYERQSPPLMPEPGVELVVYGAGNSGCDALRVLREAGYRVIAFLDANAARIRRIDGIPCHQPDGAEALALAAAGTPVVIAVFNFTADTGAIEDALRRSGFGKVLSYYALDARFPGKLKSRFWLPTCIDRG